MVRRLTLVARRAEQLIVARIKNRGSKGGSYGRILEEADMVEVSRQQREGRCGSRVYICAGIRYEHRGYRCSIRGRLGLKSGIEGK